MMQNCKYQTRIHIIKDGKTISDNYSIPNEDEQHLIDIARILVEVDERENLEFVFFINETDGVYRSQLISFDESNTYEFHYLYCHNTRFASKDICMKYLKSAVIQEAKKYFFNAMKLKKFGIEIPNEDEL
jgi:hypothetical protein